MAQIPCAVQCINLPRPLISIGRVFYLFDCSRILEGAGKPFAESRKPAHASSFSPLSFVPADRRQHLGESCAAAGASGLTWFAC
jgi:hypothetical protein